MNMMKKITLTLETVMIITLIFLVSASLYRSFDFTRMSALFPKLVSITILVLFGLLIVTRIYSRDKGEESESEGAVECQREGDLKPQPIDRRIHWSMSFFIMLGYLALIFLLGFGLSTIAYGLAFSYIAGYRKHKVIYPYALAMAVIIIMVFGKFFQIPLPEGLIFELIMAD